MAEICCGVVNESETSTPCEQSSRAARRRRMEIRRFKIVTEVAPPETENEQQKRSKLEVYTTSCSRDRDFSVENCASDEDEKQLIIKVENGKLESKEISIPSHCLRFLVLPESYPKYGVASVCGRRRDMEDAVAVHPSFFGQKYETTTEELHYFGVYDGHGCSHVAMRCRERLHELVKEELENKGAEITEWKGLLERSFKRMDREVTVCNAAAVKATCRCELQTPECDAVGSTAVVAIMVADKIVISNCGDSRAVLCRNGKALAVSSDHKPDRPDELNRIQALGGRVIYWDGARVLGVLAMSRAIGDNYLKPYVSCEPEITIIDRTAEDDCLILATDGLWDVVSNDTACGVARMCLRGKVRAAAVTTTSSPPLSPTHNEVEAANNGWEKSDKSCSDAALLLTKLALARHSSDNVSVVVVDLRKAT
ncbi:probable protein phosphatase 2C 24 isoform X1 [Mangifera indica]|uniref:probable protein phosphatase 2C 24 isoform X1 n=1 Tax=Mangifera indica TaxID=29780 RepID=UPI001CFB8EAC|nr:probable protein phosphatase 2C 24 isoform X1 [Mangifera indica]